ncbi:protein DEK [Nematolebias whitei]|uniref:protein DEK n=1 Tax=Nematolebias whitei TaxID=451745 RepID=UPI001899BA55|nr:protein DEK [Nematolebias whitei]
MSQVVEDQQEDQQSPARSSFKAFAEIIEGKRTTKTVERLDFQAPKAKEKLKIGDGGGDKLGDIPRTNYQITKMKPADLKPLHNILFDRPGKTASMKKNLRLFNGFPFSADSPQFSKKRDKLLRKSNFTNSKLKEVCTVLDLEKKGTHSDLVDRILMFLVAPKNSGKRVPVKKKRKSKKKLCSDDVKPKTKKSRPTASSSSPKKTKPGSKSKAIVMDSSSDEDEEKTGASAEAEGSDGEKNPSLREEEDQSEEEESSKPKSSTAKTKKKNAPIKRPRAPVKKAGLLKRAKMETSGESDGSSEADEKPKKKKLAAKTKKADSSSNIKNTNTVEDSSDEDEPLIRMVKKAPSDDQLKETVQGLLKEADLEEMTMKQICQRVFDTYPEHDLSSRKDFIKQTVKALIT